MGLFSQPLTRWLVGCTVMVDCNLETATRWTLAPLSRCGLGPLLQQQKGVWESGHRYAQHDLLIVNHETEPNTGLTMCLETKFPTSQYSVGSGSPATLQERVTEFPSSTVRLGAARRADGRPMREKSTQKCSYTHVFTQACFVVVVLFFRISFKSRNMPSDLAFGGIGLSRTS